MQKIIGVCGRKGGSGKTTVAVHLAAEIASKIKAHGAKVVLVDCDPQGSASYWSEPGNLPMEVHHMPIESEAKVAEWSKAIRNIKAEVIILDSPPHLDAALGGVIGLSDVAVVPCGPSGLDLMATAETVGLIRDIREARGEGKPKIVLVPNRTDHRTASGRELTGVLSDLGEMVAPEVRSRTAFSDAFNVGQWVGEYSPGSLAHEEMKALTVFVLRQLPEKIKGYLHGQQKSRAQGA
jgi:chromosome partitioning protein